jgi:hypothetical protein
VTLRLLSITTLACAAAIPIAGHAQVLPSAGVWNVSVTMEGAPSGATTRRGTACLTAAALDSAPEQTLFDAGVRQVGGRGSFKCEFRDIRRDGANAAWQAVCEGPMGPMLGTGGGVLSTQAAELQQSFSVKSPMGTLNLKQTVSALRVGSC